VERSLGEGSSDGTFTALVLILDVQMPGWRDVTGELCKAEYSCLVFSRHGKHPMSVEAMKGAVFSSQAL